ncbi:MAG: hypoxanthine phosphoribosyltransferase [Clostridia bacterium]
MHNDLEKVLVTREKIEAKTIELAAQISKDYKGKNLLLVGVLKGGFVFLSDLMRKIDNQCEVDFIMVSSYGNSTKTSGVVKIIKDIDTDISGKNILLVEDLIDTGLTLKHLLELLKTRNPKSIEICAILDKPSRRLVNLEVAYSGIEIPDEYVVGYGLDYQNKYRHLPDVCTLKPEIYKKRL